jgi:hypothetical protein
MGHMTCRCLMARRATPRLGVSGIGGIGRLFRTADWLLLGNAKEQRTFPPHPGRR